MALQSRPTSSDLSGNNSSPWDVYCAILRRCRAGSLTLCGDKEIKEFVKEIIDSLQRNITLHSLTLCASKSSVIRYKDMMVKPNTIMPQGIRILVIDGKLIFRVVHNDKEESNSRVMNIRIDLSYNRISINGMNRLSECIIHAIPLEYVDFSGNNSSPWGVYCAIIRHCSGNSLTLCGDEGMKEFVKEILDSLQANTTLCSVTLCATCRSNVRRNNNVIVKADNTKCSKNILVIDRRLFLGALDDDEKEILNGNNRVVNIKIQYDGDDECLPETINLSNKDISNDTVCLLIFGFHSNTIVKQLGLSYNNISAIGMNRLLECVKYAIPLKYVDLSGNYSSPWGVYCAIIRHCCVNSLTLCGEEGIVKRVKEMKHSLNVNTTLQSLTPVTPVTLFWKQCKSV